jgi:hypothetical protein
MAIWLVRGRSEDKEEHMRGSRRTNRRTWLIHNRLFGFLLGATTSGAGMYYYVIDEYRVSNQLLTEDIYVRPYTRPNFTPKLQYTAECLNAHEDSGND